MTSRLIRRTLVGSGAVVIIAGLVLAGRSTAGTHTGYRTGRSAGYAAGLAVGEAQGRQEGRAEQEVSTLATPAQVSIKSAFDDGYVAGENDAFTGYDGGWALKTPYVVTIAAGTGSATYRFDSRTPLEARVNYYLCADGTSLCQQARP